MFEKLVNYNLLSRSQAICKIVSVEVSEYEFEMY